MTGRISTVTLVVSILISLTFTTIIIWNLNTVFQKHKYEHENELKDFYTQKQKILIQNEVKRLKERIDTIRQSAYEDSELVLRQQVETVESLLINMPGKNINEKIKILSSSLKWDNSSGYFFILSSDKNVLYDGSRTDYARKKLSDLDKMHPELKQLITDEYNEGNGSYSYQNSDKLSYDNNELIYLKYSPEQKLLIGASLYLDKIDTQLKKHLVETLDNERFGYKNYGYFWISDTDYNAVFNVNKKRIGKNNYNLADVNGKYFFREFIDIAFTKGSGFTEYQWNLPGSEKPSTKISYLQLYPDWNWVIGAGFYYEDFYEQLKYEEEISNRRLSESIRKNTVIIVSVFVVIFFISIAIYRRIRSIENAQLNHLNALTQYKTVIDSSSIVSTTDTNGIITHANDQFCEITGYSADKLIGNKHNIIGHPDNPKNVYKDLWETISSGNIWRGIIKNMTADGGYFFQKTTVVPFKDMNGDIIRYISLSHDVTEVFENKSRLQKQLNVDFLTGLGSRTNLVNIISSSKQSDLALIDIDNFHRINEAYGMVTGDDLLMEFARKLNQNNYLASYDLFRLHSDVFAVFSYSSNIEEFSANVEKAVSEITKSAFTIQGKEILLRTSIGVASGSKNLLAHADAALQHAKATNIDLGFYDPSNENKNKIYETESSIIKMLSEAIEEDRVVPYFQKIEGTQNKSEKYECLMRIIAHDGSVVPPSEFLDISKQTRFYPKLTRIMAKKAIDTFAGTDLEFGINVSTEDVLNQDTMDFIYGYALEKHVIRNLILEIVETESITSSQEATEALYRFKLAGAKIAIDDFGTGYSNFDYLLKVKADYVKIDGSIIKLINKDERAKDIVRSIVSYSKKLNMETVAEFISEAALAEEAHNLGIDYLQGYYIGRPEKKVFIEKNNENFNASNQ
ncbi:MAG: hypothetical protein C0602_13210 [Denitrovibrio sp.]|nr:MAG: hypothetical protein C0602_13210 [Denitrovibrio sp.]